MDNKEENELLSNEIIEKVMGGDDKISPPIVLMEDNEVLFDNIITQETNIFELITNNNSLTENPELKEDDGVDEKVLIEVIVQSDEENSVSITDGDENNVEGFSDQEETKLETVPELEDTEELNSSLDLNQVFIKLEEVLDAVNKQGNSIKTVFDTKILTDGQKDKVIDNMHSELQTYRNDLYAKLTKPVIGDLVQLKEDIHKMGKYILQKNEMDYSKEKVHSILEDYALDLGDILEKYDVEIYQCDTETFIPIKQKIIKIIETDDEELDKKLAERLSLGYAMNGIVISPEKVIVHSLKK